MLSEQVIEKIEKINDLQGQYKTLSKFFFYGWNDDVDYFVIEDNHGNRISIKKGFSKVIKRFLQHAMDNIERELNDLLANMEIKK